LNRSIRVHSDPRRAMHLNTLQPLLLPVALLLLQGAAAQQGFVCPAGKVAAPKGAIGEAAHPALVANGCGGK